MNDVLISLETQLVKNKDLITKINKETLSDLSLKNYQSKFMNFFTNKLNKNQSDFAPKWSSRHDSPR